MRQIRIGDVTVDSIIERDGPWRVPAVLFPAYNPEAARRHLAEMDNFGFDSESGKIVITYQTFVVRSPRHTILVDKCSGEGKNYPAPLDFPRQPWLDGLPVSVSALRISTMCSAPTCISIIAAGTPAWWAGDGCRLSRKRDTSFTNGSTPSGRPRLHGGEPPGEVWWMNCLPVMEAGQALLVDSDFALTT
jgi:hypothetical protein